MTVYIQEYVYISSLLAILYLLTIRIGCRWRSWGNDGCMLSPIVSVFHCIMSLSQLNRVPQEIQPQADPSIEDAGEHNYWSYQSLIACAKSLLPPQRPLPPTKRNHDQSSPPLSHAPSDSEMASSLSQLLSLSSRSPTLQHSHSGKDIHIYCPACYLPIHPIPALEDLYICLHAWRYTSSLGRFESPMPKWAGDGCRACQ
jgi:hypothetical protein